MTELKEALATVDANADALCEARDELAQAKTMMYHIEKLPEPRDMYEYFKAQLRLEEAQWRYDRLRAAFDVLKEAK